MMGRDCAKAYGWREFKELKKQVGDRDRVVVLREELNLILRVMERYKGIYAIKS